MTKTSAPIKCIFIADGDPQAPIRSETWDALQAALGDGLCTAILTVPQSRGSSPRVEAFETHPSAPAADFEAAKAAFDQLSVDWRFAIETIMNRRWDLVDNPYAKVWLLPGMMILHEDPLSWIIDAAAEALEAGEPYEEEPRWAVLLPLPRNNHDALAAAAQITLPHAEILTRTLTEEALVDGHDELGDLSWSPVIPAPDALDIVGI